MARNKQNKRLETISGGYSAIPHSVLDSQAFTGASDKAKALLFALMRQHNGANNGRLHLSSKWLAKQGYTCPASNIKTRKELLGRGLIVQTLQGGLNMGADWFALTWLDISNFVGLDLTLATYQRGKYLLCQLARTTRRNQPCKPVAKPTDNKKITVSTNETALFQPVKPHTLNPVSMSETENALFTHSTISMNENNVVIPLHPVHSVKRIVGVKGKSGIAKHQPQTAIR